MNKGIGVPESFHRPRHPTLERMTLNRKGCMRMKVLYSISMFLTAFCAVGVYAAENEAAASAGYGIHTLTTAIGFALACTLVIALFSLIRKIIIGRPHPF